MTYQSVSEPYVEPIPFEPPVAERHVVVAQPAPVVEQVVVEPAVHRSVATSYGRHYAFDSVVVGIVGLWLLIMGLIAITRGGFDGTMNEPVVQVMGFTHTTTLGLIEAGIGIFLLLCAATTSRSGAVFFGLVLGVAGVVGAVQTESFDRSLALESGLAWLCVVAAAIVVLVSLMVPRVVTRTSQVESI